MLTHNNMLRLFRIPAVLIMVLLLHPAILTAQTNDECFDCHNDPELKTVNIRGDTVSAYVDPEKYINEGVHKDLELECIDCHTDISELPHAENLKTDMCCATCHEGIDEVYQTSLHGYALYRGNENAPCCADCHGKHYIYPADDNRSMTHHLNLPQTCGTCHNEYGLKKDPDIRIARAVDIYLGSVHGRNLTKGIAAAATCNDCHGTHNLKGAADTESYVNHQNIPETCAKCHGDIYYQYSNSIHGKALDAGITDTPVCTDCHGEHSIKAAVNPDSPTNKIALSEQICADCHEDPRIIEKYGLPSETFKTYKDSYHGLATRKGSPVSATCVSCHNSHYILPKLNPNSTIHADNVAETCRSCHPAADDNFAASYTHASLREDSNPVDHFVRDLYIGLIFVIIGGMIIHNMIIMSKFIREKYRFDEEFPTVIRFDRHIIAQHIILTVSFIILAVTGFALRFPEAWWVDVLTFFGLDESMRGHLHRIAAVFLIFTAIYHVLYLLMSHRGRLELRMIWLRWDDVKKLVQNIRYHLGMEETPPEFDKFDYMEKIEYWALIWGSIIMILTGFILWFPEFFTRFLPPWAFKVSETIHYFEAWLAALAVVVWHFFLVILHPDEYPMSLSWLHGKMTVNEVKSHYAGWFKKLEQQKKSDNDS